MPRPDFATPQWNKKLFEKLPASQQAMRNLLYWTHESMALAVIWNSPLTRVAERVARLHLRPSVGALSGKHVLLQIALHYLGLVPRGLERRTEVFYFYGLEQGCLP